MKRTYSISSILFLTILFLSSVVFSHGDENHDKTPVLDSTSYDNIIVQETSSDSVELVLKYSAIIPGKKTDLILFVSEFKTNKPLSDIIIEAEITDLKHPKIKFEPVLNHPGHFTSHATFPKSGTYNLVISLSGSINDLLTFNNINVESPSQINKIQKWIWILISIFIIMFWIIKKYGLKKSLFRPAVLFFIFAISLYSKNILAHGGEEHNDEKTTSNIPQDADNLVLLPKESQFLIHLETVAAIKKETASMVATQGQITPKPSGNQNILAINSGRLQSEKGQIPTNGQSVKKGDILGTLESVGTLSLKAPFDGMITFSNFHPGQWVETGTKIFTIVDPSILWIEAPLVEKDLGSINTNSTATISIEGVGQNITGKVLGIGNTLDEQTRSTTVTIELKNLDHSIRVGQWAKVYLETKSEIQTIAIPKNAILMKDGMPMVFIKKSAEHFEGRAIMMAGENKDEVFILKGVEEGEKVVVNGNYQLLPLLKKLSF